MERQEESRFTLLLPLLASAIPLSLVNRDDTSTSSTSGSNVTIDGMDPNTYALELMTINLEIMDVIIKQALLQASPLNASDPHTQVILEAQLNEQLLLNETQSLFDFHCSIPLGQVTKQIDPEQISLQDAGDLLHHYATVLVATGNAIFGNSSLSMALDNSTITLLAQAVDMAEALNQNVSSVVFPDVAVLQYPELTVHDAAASVGFPNITCSNSQGTNLPLPTAPYKSLLLQVSFLGEPNTLLTSGTEGCPTSDGTDCFCQFIFLESNGTITNHVDTIQNCFTPLVNGTGLVFITDSPDPLSINPLDRVQQEPIIQAFSILTLIPHSDY